MLILAESDDDGSPLRPELLELGGQLSKGRGLTMCATVRRGRLLTVLSQERDRLRDLRREAKDAAVARAREYAKSKGVELSDASVARVRDSAANRLAFHEYDTAIGAKHRKLIASMEVCGLEGGFGQVLFNEVPLGGVLDIFQSAGMGALKPNTVLFGWPRRWRRDFDKAARFVELLKTALRMKLTVLVLKTAGEDSVVLSAAGEAAELAAAADDPRLDMDLETELPAPGQTLADAIRAADRYAWKHPDLMDLARRGRERTEERAQDMKDRANRAEAMPISLPDLRFV